MAYRDTRDERIVQLKELVATEQEVRSARAAARARYDWLVDHAEEVGRKLAKSDPDAYDKLQSEIEELATSERMLDDKLAQIGKAREELASREQTELHAMLQAPNALGDDLRALDREIRERSTEIAAIEGVVRQTELAHTVAVALVEGQAGTGRDVASSHLNIYDRKRVASVLGPRVAELVTLLDALCAAYPRFASDTADLRYVLMRPTPQGQPESGELENALASLLSRLGMEMLAQQRELARARAAQLALVDQQV